MNIEDSIEILKNSKKLYLKEKIDSDILEEAIETLLTAYEKEKEKNKDLEDTLRCTQNSWYEDTKVIIDKDKLLEELKKYKK